MKRRLVLAAIVVAVTLAPVTAGGAAGDPNGQLEARLLQAVRDAQFGDVVEFGPFEDVCPYASFCPSPAQPVQHMPNIDVAVIELDADGHATAAANVLLSRDHPNGVVVAVDRAGGPAGSYGVGSVRWRRWDVDRHDGGTFSQTTGERLTAKGWTDNPPMSQADDIVNGRETAPVEFMAPYPASLFKVIVAFRIMRLVDTGKLTLKQRYRYDPTSDPLPAAVATGKEEMSDRPQHGPAPRTSPRPTPQDAETRSIADWMEPMITVSDNWSTRALLKLLHDRNDFPAMHAELRDLGLGTLQINGTFPWNGRNWQPGQIHMTSMDTARLLWLVDGSSGTLWTRPNGAPVRASLLSNGSRAYLKSLLADYAFNEALSTSNFCSAPNTRRGIPALVPPRWVNPDGTVTAGGYPYGHDVRPCQAASEVVFAHKTGLTFNYGADAGIVRSLPGKQGRHYVISFISSMGYRYVDPAFASATSYPCYESVGAICYTQRIPALGKQLDDYLKATP